MSFGGRRPEKATKLKNSGQDKRGGNTNEVSGADEGCSLGFVHFLLGFPHGIYIKSTKPNNSLGKNLLGVDIFQQCVCCKN